MYKYQAVILDEQRHEAPKRYIRVITDKKLHYNDIVTGSDGKSRYLILFEEYGKWLQKQ